MYVRYVYYWTISWMIIFLIITVLSICLFIIKDYIPVPGNPALWFVLSEVLLASLKHILVPIIMIMIIVMIMVEIS